MAEDGAKSGGAGPLTKKVGGQPAWIWIVVVVLFAIGVQWYRQRSAAATKAAVVGSAVPLQDPATMGTGTLPAGPGAPVATPGPQMSTGEWLAAAMKAAKNAGEDPIHAAGALNRYLNGGNLSYADTLVVNAALDAVGAPPGFASIPPGTWDSRALPGATGDTTISRLVQPAGQPGIFAEYSDGSVRWIRDPQELAALKASNPNLGDPTQLPVSDPTFSRATYGDGGSAAYAAAGGGQPYGAPGTPTFGAPGTYTFGQHA